MAVPNGSHPTVTTFLENRKRLAHSKPSGIADASAPVDLNLPDIFTAFREQLGLELESRRESAKVIVVDGATKPSEN
jgi:uncharacterized protein (TIGR03435 family)